MVTPKRKAVSRQQKPATPAKKPAPRRASASKRTATDDDDASNELALAKGAQKDPSVLIVPLTPATRGNRYVPDTRAMVDEARLRLRAAWRVSKQLDPALPAGFHSRAWSALHKVEAFEKQSHRRIDASAQRDQAIEALVSTTQRMRDVVVMLTRPDDEARTALLTRQPLRLASDPVDLCARAIDGARAVQARFPALTEALLKEATTQLQTARRLSVRAETTSADDALASIESADERQSALDVLMECMDQLRAASLVQLQASRPKLAEALSAPVFVRSRERSAKDEEGEENNEDPDKRDNDGVEPTNAPRPTPSPAPKK